MTIVLFTVLDLETAGLTPPASVIEIGLTTLFYDTDTKRIEISAPYHRLFRPAAPMTSDVVAVHHLTDAMLAGYEVCTDDDLRTVVGENRPQFLVAANCAFERQWVTDEIVGVDLSGKQIRWICTVKCAARLVPDAPSHSNQAMRYELGLDLPEHLAMPPHRAGPDSFVTAHILKAFIERGARVRDLVAWTAEPRFMTKCPIGKEWRGKPWAEVDRGFLEWVLRQPDMDEDTAHWCRVELERRRVAA